MKAVPGPSVLAAMMMPERLRYTQHLLTNRETSVPAICCKLGGVPASTISHNLHTSGTLKVPGVQLLGAAPAGGLQQDGMAAQGA